MKNREIIIGLATALFLAFSLSPFASPWPDGLEKVAEEKSFLDKAKEPVFAGIMPDYLWPVIKNEAVSTSFAGIFGTFITFVSAFLLAVFIKKRSIS